MKKIILDIEIYKNYSLFSFTDLDCQKYIELEMFDGQPLDVKRLNRILRNNTIITFNGNHYDIPVTCAALQGRSCKELKEISDHIILTGEQGWQTARRFDIRMIDIDHIDIKEPSPGVQVSLKLYGGRLGCKKLQDLPIEPDRLITPEQRKQLRLYCRNDLHTTIALYKAIENEIDLRQEMSKLYDVDLRSMSGAQVAKAVFKKLLEDKNVDVTTKNVKEGTVYKYDMPEWITFKTDILKEIKQRVTDSDFVVNAKGSVLIPRQLQKVIEFNGAKYKFGIGGLHSQESKQAIIPNDDQLLFEKDVASMYPNIILGQSLYPKHLTKRFIDVYKDLVNKRLTAKKSGDKATSESLKLVINSSFGLFGNQYSPLYSPDLLIQVTITGQLCLLMLIERVTLAGGDVVSANTDGINILCGKSTYQRIEHICFEWELDTGLELEENRYKGTFNESVNSYIAITDKGVKTKGNFALPGLMKNMVNTICIEAVIAKVTTGAAVEDTILACKDITKFLTVRSVAGGGVYNGEYLGKVVRWYYGNNDNYIAYKKNGNKVAKSDWAIPCMDLPDKFPNDLNYAWYFAEANKMLWNLGYA